MSIWADQQIKEIRADIAQLRKELDELKSAPRGTLDSLSAAFDTQFGKKKKPRREADDII